MDNKINIKKASTYYFVGTLFNKGISFITVPIFIRIMEVEDYGVITTYNAWVSIFMMFMSCALYMAIRASFIDYKETTNDFLAVIVVFISIFDVLFSVILILAVNVLSIDINMGLLIFCLLQSWATAIIECVSIYYMMKYKYKERTAIMVLPNLLSTILSIWIIKNLFHTDLYWGRIIPASLITFVVGLGVFILSLKRSSKRINIEYIKYGLIISLPLVLHGIGLNILSQSDRMMLTIIRDSTETGIYGLIYNFSMIAIVITTTLDGIWIPIFTKKMSEKKYLEINSLSVKYIELMTIILTGVILVGPEIVKLLATHVYWKGIKIIPPIVLSNYVIFIYTLFVNVEHYYKKTIYISVNTVIAAVMNIFLNIFFISKWGYFGAAYTTLISYLISLFLHYNYSKKINSELFPLKQFFVPSFIVICSIIIFYIFVDSWVIRWGIVFLLTGCFLGKEKEWIIIFIKNR